MEKKEIDQLIKESLSREEAAFYDSLEEKGLFQNMQSLYTGKLSWMAIATGIFNVIATVVSIYSLYQIFTLQETTEIVQYVAVLFIAWSFGCMVKLWQWMQMNKNSVIREMKRLEFQIAILMEDRSEK